MSFVSDWIARRATSPPLWMRIAAPVGLGLAAMGLAARRGWAVGVVAAVVCAALSLPYAFAPDRLDDWSRRHPLWDGAYFGPLLFLALAYFTPWPLWVCVAIGAGGVLIGTAMGWRRARVLARAAADGYRPPPTGR